MGYKYCLEHYLNLLLEMGLSDYAFKIFFVKITYAIICFFLN